MKTSHSEENENSALLSELFTHCKQLLELSRKQKSAIHRNDTETITRTVSEKEKIIEKFGDIKESYEQEYNQLRIEKENSIGNSKSEMRNKIDAVLEELIFIETECETALSRRCKEMEEEINQIKRSRKILNEFSGRTRNLQSSGIINEKA